MSENKGNCDTDVLVSYSLTDKRITSSFNQECRKSPVEPGSGVFSARSWLPDLPDLSAVENNWDNLPPGEQAGFLKTMLYAMEKAGLTSETLVSMAKNHLMAEILEEAGYKKLGRALWNYEKDFGDGKGMKVSLISGRVETGAADPNVAKGPNGYVHERNSAHTVGYLEFKATF